MNGIEEALREMGIRPVEELVGEEEREELEKELNKT
jgi:hypothetical protein